MMLLPSNHLEGRRKLYRSREERILMKEQTKASSLKDTWFRSGGYTSTLTVPATPDGLLAEKVRRNLEKGRQPAGTKVKVLEDGGRGARRGLVRSNQFPRENCQRLDCQLCFQADGKMPSQNKCLHWRDQLDRIHKAQPAPCSIQSCCRC